MKIKPVLLIVFVMLLAFETSGMAWAKDKLTVEGAIALVVEPRGGFANMSPFELQTCYRLAWVRYRDYVPKEGDLKVWKELMQSEDADKYARMCAAYFLLDSDEDARKFIEERARSKDPRTRFNAAKVVEMYVHRDAEKEWGVDLMIELIKVKALDDVGVRTSPEGDFPEGDRDDIMASPLDDICWGLGWMKVQAAAPVLIDLLERQPRCGGAAFALGEIGDKKAIPILMKIMKEGTGYEGREVASLGKLKAREAVPMMIERFQTIEPDPMGLNFVDFETTLAALLEIGDKRAIKPLEEYIEEDHPAEWKRMARRFLVQLRDEDPVDELVKLVGEETSVYAQSDIIRDLAKYPSERSVKALGKWGATSRYELVRSICINCLAQIGGKDALLELAVLVDADCPDDIEQRFMKGYASEPDPAVRLHQLARELLKDATKQDFGLKTAEWREWIAENVKD